MFVETATTSSTTTIATTTTTTTCWFLVHVIAILTKQLHFLVLQHLVLLSITHFAPNDNDTIWNGWRLRTVCMKTVANYFNEYRVSIMHFIWLYCHATVFAQNNIKTTECNRFGPADQKQTCKLFPIVTCCLWYTVLLKSCHHEPCRYLNTVSLRESFTINWRERSCNGAQTDLLQRRIIVKSVMTSHKMWKCVFRLLFYQ